jgi:PAS domain S-box-containing protein
MNGLLMNALVHEQDQYIVFFDNNSRVILANKSFEDLIGVSSKQIIGSTLDELGINTDIISAFQKNNEKFEAGKSVSLTYNTSLNSKGQRHYIQIQKRSLILENPNATYILAIATDVSDKKIVEERLNVTQNEYKQLVESAQDIIFRTNLEGGFEYVNLVVEKILGYTEKEFIQLRLNDIVLSEDLPKVEAFYESLLKGNNEDSYLGFRAVTKSGEVRWMGQTVTFIKKLGVIIGFQSVMRDITPFKDAEAQLKRAKEMAEEASNSKTNFIASMSHEFRTPLNAILGYAQILEKNNSLTDTEKHHVSEMAAGGEQLLGMIKDILELSALDSERIKVADDTIELSSYFRDLSVKFAEKADIKGLAFDAVTNSEGAIFEGDADKLSSVLNNLLDNAIKFTPEGSVHFAYDVVPNEKGAANLKVTIKDSGIGIAKEDIDQIFEPFWQYDNIKYKGTGLGLTLCKRLIDFMRGSIEVKSEQGESTEIRISIPVIVVEKATVIPLKPRKGSFQNDQHEGVRVLIVDDLETNRTITRIILDQNGFSFKEAEHGEEAIMMIDDYQPDVILMDINMPVMDGIEATRHIRNLENGFSDIPVIAVTAGGFKAEKMELLQEGFNDFILKPFREDELIGAIQKALNINKEVKHLRDDLKKISHREVASFIKTMKPEQVAKVHSVLRLQDMESIAALGEILDLNGDSDSPYLTKLEDSARDFDYLFITRVFKDLVETSSTKA